MFAGGGFRRQQLEKFCREQGIANVVFRPYSSRAELGASLAEGHLGLVTQLPQTCGSIVPSKTYGIMAAGRPILYIGPREATPARIIERFQCGWQVDPGDTAALPVCSRGFPRNAILMIEAGRAPARPSNSTTTGSRGLARIVKILGLEPAQIRFPSR